MRLLFVTSRLPSLPCHDAARLAASQLVDRLVDRHAVAVVAASGGGDTPAQRAWLAERAARVETVPLGRWRQAWAGRPGDALAALDTLARHVAERFAPDVIHLEGGLLAPLARGAGAATVLACHEAATLGARDVRRAGASAWRRLAGWMDERAETAWAREHGPGAGAARQRREQAALQMDHVGCEAFGDVPGQRVERRERVAGPAGPRLPPAAERHRLDARRTLGQPGALRRRVAAAGGRDDGHGVAIDEAVDELRRRQTRGVVARQGRQP